MFDIGWPEIVVVLIVAIVVIGPRDLPKAFYTVGKWVRAARRVTSDFQRHVDDMVRETELEDIKNVATQARSLNVKSQIEKAIDPSGDLKGAFDVDAPAAAKSKNTMAKPGAPASPGPGVPVGAKHGAETLSADAALTAPAKPTAKKADRRRSESSKPPARTTAKSSPRVPSRVPKRVSPSGEKSSRSKAAKAPPSEKTS